MGSYKDVVYSSQNLKETNELIEIWRKNDKNEWSEEALEIVHNILIERLGKIPEYLPDEDSDITDDQNIGEGDPEFYNPKEVNRLTNWFRFIPLGYICLVGLRILFGFETYSSLPRVWFPKNPVLIIVATVLLIATELAFAFVTFYIPMKTLGYILQVIFQMEKNSRPKSKVLPPVIISGEK